MLGIPAAWFSWCGGGADRPLKAPRKSQTQLRSSNQRCRDVQEIAPFLRVLGCYPMDLGAGDAAAAAAAAAATAALAEELLMMDDGANNGGGRRRGDAMRTDDLLMAVSGASMRVPAMRARSLPSLLGVLWQRPLFETGLKLFSKCCGRPVAAPGTWWLTGTLPNSALLSC